MRKKLFLSLMLFSAFVLSVGCQTKTSGEKVKPCKFLSFAEAEKILGSPVELVTNSWNFADGESRFDCQYRSIKNDESSGREINLFFRLEESADEIQAKNIYKTIWDSNKSHDGIEILSGIGDEAYSHSDRRNFHFVLVRKGKFTIRLKVNRIADTTSFDELKAFAKRAVERI